jgi:hypothetical protein
MAMKRKSKIAILGVALIIVAVPFLVLIPTRYPDAKATVETANAFLFSNGYRLDLEMHNEFSHKRPPLTVELWSLQKEAASYFGLHVKNPHPIRGDVLKYKSIEGHEVNVMVDIFGERAFNVTLLSDTTSSNLLSNLRARLSGLDIPTSEAYQPTNVRY